MAFISLQFAVLLLCVRPARLYANATASRYDAVVKRQKRFLVFEKGASITLQGNNAKSILPGVPRGLNVLFEYTVFYDLPTGLDLIKKKFAALESRFTTKTPDRLGTMRHGFQPRNCFMRTLCEARHLLLPYGYSLLHDVIHIFLSYTIPWVARHEQFSRSLSGHHTINDCSKFYGAHCRVSWLSYVTTAVHGSFADFIE
uniref:Uncharacterized protein n=1 Tax=Stomoxys calcitrans TaxID=35570 RepID=A0A1I8NQQ6_STOCA